MDPHWSQRESGWLWMIANQYSRAVQVHPGLTSWGILSRPYGTGLGGNVHPGLTSWATLSRPCGTDRDTPPIAEDSAHVDRWVRRMNRESEGKSSGIPHLAKNERDMAHPSCSTGLGYGTDAMRFAQHVQQIP